MYCLFSYIWLFFKHNHHISWGVSIHYYPLCSLVPVFHLQDLIFSWHKCEDTVFWDWMLRSFTDRYWHSGGSWCLQFQGRIVGLPNYAVSHPRRLILMYWNSIVVNGSKIWRNYKYFKFLNDPKQLYIIINFPAVMLGLVVGVHGYMSRVRFPAVPDFLRSSGSGTGSTQLCEDNWGATWMER
jgi:hypothetical protein